MEENPTQETPTETTQPTPAETEPQEQPPIAEASKEAAPQEPTPEPIQPAETVVAPETEGLITELPLPMPQPAPKAPEKPSVGRIVHYVLKSGRSEGQHRPMIIVNVFGQTEAQYVNAQVFLDGSNDFGSEFQQNEGNSANLAWATSVPYSAEPKPGTWHWPERV